jgi:hypothetical protein
MVLWFEGMINVLCGNKILPMIFDLNSLSPSYGLPEFYICESVFFMVVLISFPIEKEMR